MNGRGFLWRVVVALAAGIAWIVVAGLIGLHFHALPTHTIAVVCGFGWWVLSSERSLESVVEWSAPAMPVAHGRASSDITTRRLATVCADAAPGRGFTPSALQTVLRERVDHRLRGRDARTHLSPGLAGFLEADEPPNVTRRVLRTYLKEIQAL